jgi:predicted GH43/DUF377 family glycosyl hydrolase
VAKLKNEACAVLVPYAHSIETECEDGLRALQARGYSVFRRQGSAIDQMRCAMATDALSAGFQEILWIDSDIGFSPADADRIRSHGQPIVCGLYPVKSGAGVAAKYLPKAPKFGDHAGLWEIDLAATGFLYTSREVYDALGMPECNLRGKRIRPYFLPMLSSSGGGLQYLGEDFAFCQRARQKGYKIFADTKIKLRHIGRFGFEIDSSTIAASIRPSGCWHENPAIVVVGLMPESDVEAKLDRLADSLVGRKWGAVLADRNGSAACNALRAEFLTIVDARGRDSAGAINMALAKAAGSGFEAVLISDLDGQMFDRLSLLDDAVQSGSRITVGDSTLFGVSSSEVSASEANSWRCPIFASVIHRSVIEKVKDPLSGPSPEWKYSAWKSFSQAGFSIDFRPGATSYVATAPNLALTAEEIQVESDLFFQSAFRIGSQEPAWERITDIDPSGLQRADLHFNPGLIERGGKLLMAYRFDLLDKTPEGRTGWDNHVDIGIGICELGQDLQPVAGTDKRIDLPAVGNQSPKKCEDPRLFDRNGELHISYTNSFPKPGRAAAGVAKLDDEFNVLQSRFLAYGKNVCKQHRPLVDGGPLPVGCEKNWAFFAHGWDLYAVYDIPRHIVIKANWAEGTAQRIAGSDSVLRWPFGEIRGGTPPVRVEDEFFAFFHSSAMPPSRYVFDRSIYSMGFYAFEAKAPYRITRYTPMPLMSGGLYDPCPQRPGVVFPAGAVYRDGRWLVSYGHNDFKCKIVEFDHQRLLKLCRRP